jgi:hypothetical protein
MGMRKRRRVTDRARNAFNNVGKRATFTAEQTLQRNRDGLAYISRISRLSAQSLAETRFIKPEETWTLHFDYFVKIDFGSIACIPFVPSTTWVTIRSIAALNSM